MAYIKTLKDNKSFDDKSCLPKICKSQGECVSMGYIHCCSAMHKAQNFVLQPNFGFVTCELDYLEKCPTCGHFSK